MGELVRSEKDRRLLKWVAAIVAGVALLTIAATVGLTFAVVKLSQDVSVSESNAMVAKGSGAALEAGANIRAASLAEIMASPNPAAMLAHLTHLTVPGAGDEDLVVHGVASAALLADGAGLRVRTVGNETFEFAPAPAAPPAAGRRLASHYSRRPDSDLSDAAEVAAFGAKLADWCASGARDIVLIVPAPAGQNLPQYGCTGCKVVDVPNDAQACLRVVGHGHRDLLALVHGHGGGGRLVRRPRQRQVHGHLHNGDPAVFADLSGGGGGGGGGQLSVRAARARLFSLAPRFARMYPQPGLFPV